MPTSQQNPPGPSSHTAEGHTRALPSPAPSAPGNQGLQSREQPCRTHLGLAEQDVGRQGLNRPPQPRVAKGNTKCQSHQPQYVRAPAKRSSAESALVQAVPAPLPRPGTAGTVPCPRGREGKGSGARWEPGRRDDALSGTRGRWSHQSVKCQDVGERPEGTLPGHCHRLSPGARAVHARVQHFGGAQGAVGTWNPG